MATQQRQFDVIEHTRVEEREARNGRIVSATITTWDVVDVEGCSLIKECETPLEAEAVVTALARKAAR